MRSNKGSRPPSVLLRALEGRAWYEMGAFVATSPLLRFVGRGDRHPVLVLPGFTAGDRSTQPLRWALRGQGYWTHGWQLGRNLGPTARVVEGIEARLIELNERHGRAVSVVGWSLGGIYARQLARLHPDRVRQVITLGSPFRAKPGERSTVSPLWDSLEPGFIHDFDGLFLADPPEPIAVPATAIYTKTDGVVRWHLCLEDEGPRRESIAVRGSHSGLGVNPAVVVAVSDRLAQRDGTWRPFKPLPGSGCWYPKAETYRAAGTYRAAETAEINSFQRVG